MATDNERREVAAKLRQMADAHDATEASRVARALGLEYKVHGTVVAFGSADICNLADLIDPTCKVVRKKVYAGGPQMHKTLWCCSECAFPLAESKCKGHVQFVAENFCPDAARGWWSDDWR